MTWFTRIFSLELCYVFPYYKFPPVYGENMSIPCLFLLQIDKESKNKITQLLAIFIAFYFGTGYESWKSWKEYYKYPNECCKSVAKIRNAFFLGKCMKKLSLPSPHFTIALA